MSLARGTKEYLYEVYAFLQVAPDEITVVAESHNCSGCNKLYSGGQGAIQFDVTVPGKNIIWGANILSKIARTSFSKILPRFCCRT